MTRIWKGKRILSLALALILLMTSVNLPAPIFAANEEQTASDTTEQTNPMVGKFVKLNSSYPWLWTDPNSTASQVQGDASKLPKVMVIVDVYQYGASTTLYQLDAAEGYTWPAGYPVADFTGKYWIESTKVTVLEPCDKCGKLDCGSSHENWCEICKVDNCTNDHISATVTDIQGNPVVGSNGEPLKVTVAGDLPDGATVVASVPEINGEALPGVFDIKVLKPDGTEWQPIDEGKTVTVSIPVDDIADGDFVNVFHVVEHEAAIPNTTKILDISEAPDSIKLLFEGGIAACDDACIAVDMFADVQVKNGKVIFNTNSFSIYVYDEENKEFDLAQNASGIVTIPNINGDQGSRFEYAATVGSVFTLEPQFLGLGNYTLISNNSSGVTIETVSPSNWADALKGRAVKVTLNDISVGDVVTIQYYKSGMIFGDDLFFVDIKIVREVKVSFDDNGKTDATGMPDPLEKMIATDGTIVYTIPEGELTADNCKFKGWALNNAGTGILYQPGDTITLVNDITFYAVWEEEKFDVSFNHNYKNGDNDPVVDVIKNVEHHTTIEFPEPPYRENYTFLGWCASSNGQGDRYIAGDKITVTSAATYYAIWGADLTITISGNISEIKMMEGTEQTWKNVPQGYFTQAGQSANREDVEGFLKGTTFRIKAAGISNFKAGAGKAYTSSGAAVTFWTEDDGKTLFVQLPNGITEDTSITITTETDKFTVSYVPNGGTAVEPDLNVPYDTPINPNDKTTTREGYTFDGWYSDAALAQKVTQAVSITAHTTFYAKWKADGYKINYDLDGGSLPEGVINPDTYTVESEDFVLINPAKEGYTFAGWIGTGLTEATKVVTITQGSSGNRRYTAIWAPITYTVTYFLTDSNGLTGTNHADNPAFYTIESGEIVLKDPTPPAGYRFVKWVEGNTIAEGSTGDKTFTAVWEPALSTLTIDVKHPNGADYSIDGEQSFLFDISADEKVILTVAVLKDGYVTIDGLTIGKTYTVTLKNSWSWRYGGEVSKTVTIAAGGSTVEFEVSRDKDKWLDGNDYWPNSSNQNQN